MSTSSHSCPGESQRRRSNRRRLAIVGLAAGVLLSSVSCTGRPADKVEDSTFVDSRPSQQPLIRIDDGRAVHVDPSMDTIFPRSERTRMKLGDVWDPARGDIYFHEKLRSMLVLEDGLIVPEALPRDTLVIVQEAVVADRLGTERTASQPDVHTYGGAEWWQMSGTGGSAGTGSTASPGGGVAPATNGQVCPDIKGKIRGCDE